MNCVPSKAFLYWRDPVCLASWAGYILNRFSLKPMLGPDHVFMHGHFNDALLIPSALPPLLGLHRLCRLREHDGKPTWGELVGHLILWSFFFEYYGPRFLHRSTGDWGDVTSYWIGGLLAWGLWSLLHRAHAPAPPSKTLTIVREAP